ncbi:MAG: hypothetical protein ABIJ17_02560 [Patescibacteria group bacterium]
MSLPFIRTPDQNFIFFETGDLEIFGDCEDKEQFFLLIRNDISLNEVAYYQLSGNEFNIPCPIISGENRIKVKSFLKTYKEPVDLTPLSTGQTLFTVGEAYIPGSLQVFRDGYTPRAEDFSEADQITNPGEFNLSSDWISANPFAEIAGVIVEKLTVYYVTDGSTESNEIIITGIDREISLTPENFTLASVAESFFERLVSDTTFHAWCTSNIGILPKIYLGVDEKNYPKEDFYIAIMPDKKSDGETENSTDVYITVGIVLKDNVVVNDFSDPYALVKYEKMAGVLLVEEIGIKVKEYLSLEACKHCQSLDDVERTIQRTENFDAFVCQLRIIITVPTEIGSNEIYKW